MTSSDHATALVGVAARAIGRAGLAHAYGHCSVRCDAEHFLVSPAKPLGMVCPDDPPIRVAVEGPMPAEVLGEVRIHQQIYRSRADVGGIVRFQSPKVVSLSALGRSPRALHGFGSYFSPSSPFWNDPRLVRDDARAASVVAALGSARGIVLRGNGAVVVGTSLEEACVMAWYLEDAARVELDVLSSGEPGTVFSDEEAADRATLQGRIIERMWDWLTRDESREPGREP
jgi:HCOMODA/2-hydroxy-3-carboxy-muconic semialdehyde decarboxylase